MRLLKLAVQYSGMANSRSLAGLVSDMDMGPRNRMAVRSSGNVQAARVPEDLTPMISSKG